MKKTLIALAAASLCCGAASAASVTLYGIADLGLTYNHYDHKGDAGKSHTFSMESGQKNGSRWGLKGVEELGDGWTVGFVLEGGFSADDGTIGQNSRVFGRESQIFIDGPYGKIGFGRVGAISTDAGSYGLSDKINSFGTGWGNDQVIGSSHTVFASKPLRLDNSITYVSPEFYGLKLHAQYSMKNDSKAGGTENKSDSDRYGALAVTYQNGNFEALVLADWLNKARPAAGEYNGNDQWTVTVGGNYNCGFAKTFIGAQYFKNANEVGFDNFTTSAMLGKKDNKGYGKIDGFGVLVSTDIPVWGGDFLFSVGYMNAKNKNLIVAGEKDTVKLNRWMVGAGYDYPISKRTNVYAAGGYVRDCQKLDGKEVKPSAWSATVGLVHKF